jgi:mRNA interferase RelE/StbE
MRVNFHNNAIKFLEKCPNNDKEKIKVKIKQLVDYYQGIGLTNYHDLKVKNLEGVWKGFRRLRIGKIRIIYFIDKTNEELLIYEIDYRGDVYK